MNRDVWYYLVDEQGDSFKGVGADIVSINTESKVVHFRDAVWAKNKEGLLKGVSAVQLKVYTTKDNITDPTKEPLEVDASVNGMGEQKREALFVVVPKKTGMWTFDIIM